MYGRLNEPQKAQQCRIFDPDKLMLRGYFDFT